MQLPSTRGVIRVTTNLLEGHPHSCGGSLYLDDSPCGITWMDQGRERMGLVSGDWEGAGLAGEGDGGKHGRRVGVGLRGAG